jgi:hypothetical protein
MPRKWEKTGINKQPWQTLNEIVGMRKIWFIEDDQSERNEYPKERTVLTRRL